MKGKQKGYREVETGKAKTSGGGGARYEGGEEERGINVEGKTKKGKVRIITEVKGKQK